MNGFLVDVNLTYRVDVWRSNEFQYLVDIDETLSDSEIWNYAKLNNLTVLTKDSDFADRIMLSSPPPRIIHFKIGNIRLAKFVLFIDNRWSAIKLASESYKLVSVFRNRIEVIDN